MDITWSPEKRKLGELVPWEKNPRKATAKQKKDLEKSLTTFNVAEPLVINLDNRIIGGHFRHQLLLNLHGRNFEIAVMFPDRLLTEEEAVELSLRLNKNTGGWDNNLLAELSRDLMIEVGFDEIEVDDILGKIEIEEDDFDAQAEYDKIKEPKTRHGDVYVMGDHRLMCGDSAKGEDVLSLMAGEKARLIFTDPPYNVDYRSPGGMSYNSTKFGGTGGKIFNDNKSDKDCLQFYTDVLNNLYLASADDATIYWWFASKNDWINRQAFVDTGWHRSQIIIWLKPSPVLSMGQDYHRCYEPCFMGWKKGQKHYSNRKIRNLKDVFNLDDMDQEELFDVWMERRDNTAEYVHPTQKPVRLPGRALRKNSEPGDLVIDLFGGSGSTLIACQQMGRRARLMELDPKYCDVIVARWEKFTGRKAELITPAMVR